jgi:ADP-heptose:LPS heptosyltransferase
MTKNEDVWKIGATFEDVLGKFFSEFLDENAFSQFRSVERLIKSLKLQGQTESGYPLIRPADCGRTIAALSGIFETSQPFFRTRDPEITNRFEQLISDFLDFCLRVYPGEAIGAILLRGRVNLFMGDAKRALETVEHYALRPYAVEGGVENCIQLMEIFAQAHLQLGTLKNQKISFVAFGRWVASFKKNYSPSEAAARMAPFSSFNSSDDQETVIETIIRWASIGYQDASKGRPRLAARLLARVRVRWYRLILSLCYMQLRRRGRGANPFSLRRTRKGRALVTRGMGGIGDLLMMAPGLEALAKRQKAPVDFAIQRKFHPIFRNNPHVNLIDIDGPPINISNYKTWYNLTICPAGIYESRHRPIVRKGRVELFARAMRINKKRLDQQGWKINYFCSDDEHRACDDFLAQRGASTRRLIGVQPFSRDSYKDHARIVSIIRTIAEHHDVLIFHHLSDGLPTGAGIYSTAGMPLGTSLALVSRIEAMVAVDSAFLHAAAAFDVPVVALFGPTDARTFTRHHKKVKILWKPEFFGCVPCWRNEDMPCVISGLKSMSPCVGLIGDDEVLAALDEFLI